MTFSDKESFLPVLDIGSLRCLLCLAILAVKESIAKNVYDIDLSSSCFTRLNLELCPFHKTHVVILKCLDGNC